jgi:hypothetical protein
MPDNASFQNILHHALDLFVYEAALEEGGDLPAVPGDRMARAEMPHGPRTPCLASQPYPILSVCIDLAAAVLLDFVTLSQNIALEALPTFLHLRVMHAAVILVNRTISLSRNCSAGWYYSVRTRELQLDRQLDDLIEAFASSSGEWPGPQCIKALLKLRAKLRENQENSASMKVQTNGTKETTMGCLSCANSKNYPFTPGSTVNLSELPSPRPPSSLTYQSPWNPGDMPTVGANDTCEAVKSASGAEGGISCTVPSPVVLEDRFSLEDTSLEPSGVFTLDSGQ